MTGEEVIDKVLEILEDPELTFVGSGGSCDYLHYIYAISNAKEKVQQLKHEICSK